MSITPSRTVARVDDLRSFNVAGPWKTKSDAELNVLFNLPMELLKSSFFNYDTPDMSDTPEDIRGLRAYTVKGIGKEARGANEWHKLRHELVFALGGSVLWSCKDIYGTEKSFRLDANKGIWVKPYILHAYESLQENSSLLVITNTLFIPDRPETHDTFSAESFAEITKNS